MEKNMDKAYSEILDILEQIETEYMEKVPQDMIEMFKEDCDKDYLNKLKKDNTDLKQKKYSEEALAIIAFLNLKYWCETDEEKKKYRDMYLNNK